MCALLQAINLVNSVPSAPRISAIATMHFSRDFAWAFATWAEVPCAGKSDSKSNFSQGMHFKYSRVRLDLNILSFTEK